MGAKCLHEQRKDDDNSNSSDTVAWRFDRVPTTNDQIENSIALISNLSSALNICMLLSLKFAITVLRSHSSAGVFCRRMLNHRSRNFDLISVLFDALALSSLSLGLFLELCCLRSYFLGTGDGSIEDNAPSETVQEYPYQIHCSLINHCQRVADVLVRVQPHQLGVRSHQDFFQR